MPVPDLSLEEVARSKSIAEELVRVMGLDNGVTFTPFPAQSIRLQNAVQALLEEGFPFSEENIKHIACGEAYEVWSTFEGFQGFKGLTTVLGHIFNGAHLV